MMGMVNTVFLLNQATPDTSGYMIAGYVVIFSVMLLYLLSLFIRRRNLEKDYETLEEIEKMDAEKKAPAPPRPAESLQK